MHNIVWSVNIMCAILIVLVAVALVYIFKYDDWYPNPSTHNHVPESDGSGLKELGS